MSNPYKRALFISEITQPAEIEFLIGEKLTDLMIDLANGMSVYSARLHGAKNPKPPFGKSKKKKPKESTIQVPDGEGGIKLIKVLN